jgi:hypothetical protein
MIGRTLPLWQRDYTRLKNNRETGMTMESEWLRNQHGQWLQHQGIGLEFCGWVNPSIAKPFQARNWKSPWKIMGLWPST